MSIDAVVLGASGYVGGELLRLIHGHPDFELFAAVSANNGGRAIGEVFPHLAAAFDKTDFSTPAAFVENMKTGSKLAVFSAAPHGASASAVAAVLAEAEKRDVCTHVVDSSADFRYADPMQFEATYGIAHPEPGLLENFFCAVPEHAPDTLPQHAGHPGCFATAILLAAVPLVDSGLVTGDLFVSAITGSTGSGRAPQPGTHHPERHSNLYAYKPLAHRHVPEIQNLVAAATGRQTVVKFIPHSGPFARGIYATLQAAIGNSITADVLRKIYQDFYAHTEFVRIVEDTPRLKDVVASNYAHIGVTTDGDTAVVMCAIDNLVKGAAGGALQWMNRMWSLPETRGLLAAAPAWT